MTSKSSCTRVADLLMLNANSKPAYFCFVLIFNLHLTAKSENSLNIRLFKAFVFIITMITLLPFRTVQYCFHIWHLARRDKGKF